MTQRALEISGTGRHLKKDRGFLVISENREELGRVPLDDLEIVLFAGHGLSCTSEVMNALAERAVPLVLCNAQFLPASLLWPTESHSLQSYRIRSQVNLSLPTQKRLWQQIVRTKIAHQAAALEHCTGSPAPRLHQLAKSVRSGDQGNLEGEAARIYFPLLFGPEFRRDREALGINTLLNYGYTILRSAVARAVMLAGLHPAFSLHHHGKRNTMPLVDDLIEPFRPIVDVLVYEWCRQREDFYPDLDRDVKSLLVGVTSVDMVAQAMASPVSECLLRLSRSLAEVCEGKRKDLALPDALLHLEEEA